MASINIMKIKSKNGIKQIIQHNKREHERYSNDDIDLTKTELNGTYQNKTGDECYQYFKDRLDELDRTTNTNFRKDRVEAIGIEFVIPVGIDSKKFEEFSYNYLKNKYGEENIISADCHRDEVHDYLDNGEVKTSLEHIHAIVIPVDETGKLNAKKVMGNKFDMKQMQKDFDELVFKEFGIKYQKGTVPKKKTVEELKKSSEIELSERKGLLGKVLVKKDKYNQLVNKANLYQQAIDEKNRLDSSFTNIDKEYKATKKIAKEINDKSKQIKRNEEIYSKQKEIIYNQKTAIEQGKMELDRIKSQYDETSALMDKIKALQRDQEEYSKALSAYEFVKELMQILEEKTISGVREKLGLKSRAKNEVSLDKGQDR